MRSAILVALLLVAGGCSDVPRDPAGTLDKVRQTGLLRVGIVSDSVPPSGALGSLIAQLAQETGSRPGITRGSPEVLLTRIEHGDLDIVIGRFASDSPWATRVTFLPALEQADAEKGEALPAAAVRNGENGWIARVYKHASELATDPR